MDARRSRTSRRLLILVASAATLTLGLLTGVTAAGAVTYSAPLTVALNGLSTPSGIAVDNAGDVFVANSADNDVVELPAAGGQQTLKFTGLMDPEGIAVDSAGDVYVGSVGNHEVAELSAAQVQSTVPLNQVVDPYSLAVDPSGDLYVSDSAVGLTKVTLGGQQLNLGFGGGAAGPVAVDRAGNVFIDDLNHSQVDELVAGTAKPRTLPFANISYLAGLAVDPSGDVFVSANWSGNGHDETLELPAGGQQQMVAAFDGLVPGELATDPRGDLFTAAPYANAVYELPTLLPTGTLTLRRAAGAPGATIDVTSVTPCPSGTSEIDLSLSDSMGRTVSTSRSTMLDSTGDWAGTLNIPATAPAGGYFVAASCQDAMVLQNYAYAAFEVTTPLSTTTTVSAGSVQYGQPVTISVAVTAGSGHSAPTGSVSVSVDGVAQTAALSAGSAAVTLPDLGVGAHQISADYTGAVGFAASTGSATVTVTKAATALSAPPAGRLSGHFTATLTRADDGAPVVGESVAFSTRSLFGGSDQVCTAVTGANGVASCTGTIPLLDLLLDSSYTVSYAGSGNYLATSATGPLQ